MSAAIASKCSSSLVREQGWLAGRRLWYVEMIGNDRLGREQIALLHVCVHPRTAALRWTSVVVAEEQRQRFAVAIVNFEYAHVRLINGNVMPLLEGETVKFPGGEKYAVEDDVIQLVVRPQLRFVEGVTRLTDFLGIKSPIRGADLKSAVFFIDKLLHVGCFAPGVCDCWRARSPRSLF